MKKYLILMICLSFFHVGCDLDNFNPDGLFIPLNGGGNPNANPNGNPGADGDPITFCAELYTFHDDHFNNDPNTIDVLHAVNWVRRAGPAAATLTHDLSIDPCPVAIVPEQAFQVPFVVGGRYSGGPPPANPEEHAYFTGAAMFGWLQLDRDITTINTSIVNLNSWVLSNNLRPVPPIDAGNGCIYTIDVNDVVVTPHPNGLQWQTDGSILITLQHPTDVEQCLDVTAVPPGPFAPSPSPAVGFAPPEAEVQ